MNCMSSRRAVPHPFANLPLSRPKLAAILCLLSAACAPWMRAQSSAPIATFPSTSVGATSAAQLVTFALPTAGTISSITIPSSLGGKLEYKAGAVSGCVVDGVTTNPAATVCSVSVTFNPAYPGLRQAPLVVTGSSDGYRFGLSGVGTAPLSIITPGIVVTVAGTGINGSSGSGGPATSAKIDVSQANLSVDSAGNLYIVDPISFTVRKVDAATGIITTVAGRAPNYAAAPNYADGSPATQTDLITPYGVAIDGAGNLYVLDSVTIRNVGTPAALIYPTATAVGTLDTTDDPLDVTLSNIGNAPLIVAPSSATNDPVISFAWTLDSASTCQQVTPANPSAYSLAAGSSCVFALDFKPTVSGANTGALAVTDNSLNAATSTQTVSLSGVGTGSGSLTITPISQSFSATVVGARSSTAVSTIANTTASAITLSTGTLTDATDFTATDDCNGVVASGASCSVTFTFTPKSVGALASTYSVHDVNNPSAPLMVTLSGTGTGTPAAAFSPSALTFTSSANTQANNQTTTLTNAGTVALAISAVTITGTNAGSFTIVTNGCGTTLAAGASCAITVGFTSVVAGTYTASLTATDNASPATQSVSLTGTVAGVPIASLTPVSLSFSTIQGTSSVAQQATLSNTGTAPLTITSVALAGADASFFTQTNACGTTLAAGSSCTVSIVFSPAATRAFTASLVVTDNSGSTTTTQTVSLSGMGTAIAAPQAALTPATANFGSVTPGSASVAQIITLTNAGTAALPITSISLSGSNASSFTLGSNSCGASLASGAACTVSVTFTPSTAGTFTASLSVVDSVGTQSSTLSGTAVAASSSDFSVAPTPASQSTYRGSAVTYNIQVSALQAANPFLNAVTLSITGLPQGATASFSPTTLVPGIQANTVLTIHIPALSAAGKVPLHPDSKGRNMGISLAVLLAGVVLRRRKRRLPQLLTLLALCGISALALSTTGCGTGNGFAVPTSTSTITITGTSGTIVHTTTVTLTVQ